MYLASALRKAGHRPHILDLNKGNLEPKNTEYYIQTVINRINESVPGLIGLNCLISDHFPFIHALSSAIKKEHPDIPIVIGGLHPTLFAQDIIRNCPEIGVVVLGEGETQIVALADHFSVQTPPLEQIEAICFRNVRGEISLNIRVSFIHDLDALPDPAWDLVNLPDYFADHSNWYNPRQLDIKMSAPILTSRSCPYDCNFCSVHTLMGRGLRLRHPIKVVDEMENLYRQHNINYFGFLDDNLTLNKSHIMTLCNEIVKRGLNIQFESINGYNLASLDEEIIDAMAKAGCVYVILPIEHGSDYMREKVIGKRLSREKIFEVASLYKKYNLLTRGYFIMGFPEETPETLMETYTMIQNLQLDMNNVFNLIPFPGTKVFDQALRDNLLIGDIDASRLWTGQLGLHADNEQQFYIKPYTMTLEELSIFRKKFDMLRIFSQRVKS
jgi:radical SAM superfamily enzyme YgiQ (UPF0313 family)